jgi:hypothetical protein
MDYNDAINHVYEHLDNNEVDKAVFICLRIARNLKDYLYAAVFLREMYPNKRECMRIFLNTTKALNDEARKYLWENSLEYWFDTHQMDFNFGTNEDGEERNILAMGISEIDADIIQSEQMIDDYKVPTGMSEFDTAAFTDSYSNRKAELRIRIKALQTIKARVKTRCFNYAMSIEQQLEAQSKPQIFLAEIQNSVNNYFKTRSEDVYTKLQKAAQLIDSNDPEDCSLLLTQVRRAIKASADFFYPPKVGVVKCSDGKERQLGDEQYLNRLNEYIATAIAKSASKDLLRAELDYLSVFARRLNEVASKGVHAEVSVEEAKQGLLGLYLFLFNVTSRLQNAIQNAEVPTNDAQGSMIGQLKEEKQ